MTRDKQLTTKEEERQTHFQLEGKAVHEGVVRGVVRCMSQGSGIRGGIWPDLSSLVTRLIATKNQGDNNSLSILFNTKDILATTDKGLSRPSSEKNRICN